MITKLEGPPACITSFLIKARRPLAFYGPLKYVAGEAVFATAPHGLSNFGGPPPAAVEYCLPGAGKYAKKLDPPYTLEDLLEALPGGLRDKARESTCLRQAFFLSRVDASPIKRSLVVLDDVLLFLSLEPYMPLYTTEPLMANMRVKRLKCNPDPLPPPSIRAVDLKVLTPEEYVNKLYIEGLLGLFLTRVIRKTGIRLIWYLLKRL